MVTTKQSQKPLKRLLLTMSALAAIATSASAQNRQQAEYEVWFLQSMIDHHAQAIQLANLATSRTNNPTVLYAASSVVRDRSSEITTMQGWLRNWYGISYTPRWNAPSAELASLTGQAFDWSFMDVLSEHNATATSAAQQAQNAAFHPALADAAQHIAMDHTTENNQIAQWSSSVNSWNTGSGTVDLSARGPFPHPGFAGDPNMNYLFSQQRRIQPQRLSSNVSIANRNGRGPFPHPGFAGDPNMNYLFGRPRTGVTVVADGRGPFPHPGFAGNPNMNYLFRGTPSRLP